MDEKLRGKTSESLIYMYEGTCICLRRNSPCSYEWMGHMNSTHLFHAEAMVRYHHNKSFLKFESGLLYHYDNQKESLSLLNHITMITIDGMFESAVK